MSVPTAEPTVPPLDVGSSDTRMGASRYFAGGRAYGWLAAAALAVAAVSLLIPSTPSYDPWSWLVWGREILHGGLHTPGGPTWKPLPVIFTTVLALFGHLQPDLWLVIARAGATLTIFMVFKLAFRMTWWLQDAGADSAGSGTSRLGRFGPALVAGLIAAVSLALTGEFLDASALGYSEGLMVAATLIALERHVDGHYRQAFAVGFVAALDRPEVWIFWGPYGLWLMWKDPGARAMVIGLGVLTLLLWFVPQKLGGGSFTSGISRAHHPRSNSAAFASCPFCTELKDHAWPLVLLRIKIAAAVGVLLAVVGLGRGMRTRPGWRLTSLRERALLVLVLSGVFGVAWWVIVAVETQAGFSGNDRYLVLGSAFIVLAGGIGFGWLAIVLVRLAGRVRRSGARSALAAPAGAAAAVLSGLVFVFAPNWVGSNLIGIGKTHGSLVYQAHLREDLASLISSHGGAKAILACGPVMTEGFQVPMLAWYLNVRTIDVLDQPATNEAGLDPVPAGKWPATIFQDRDNRGAELLPTAQTILGWEHEGAKYKFEVGKHRAFYFFQDCRAPASGAGVGS